MLKQRILTALLLIPLVLWLVLFAPLDLFAVSMMLIIALAANEWGMLCGLCGAKKFIFSALLLLLMLSAWFSGQAVDYANLLWVVSGIWAALTVWLVVQRAELKSHTGVNPGGLLLGAVLLFVAWFAVVEIRRIDQVGSELVMILLLMIWIADSAAYFSGITFGKHKLSPRVSPGKSWEGLLGGMLGVAVFGYFMTGYDYFSAVNPWMLAVLFVLIGLVSVGGDLFESRIKRQRGVKDSGNLLPGHGGIYDRIDSLIAASPVYLLGLTEFISAGGQS